MIILLNCGSFLVTNVETTEDAMEYVRKNCSGEGVIHAIKLPDTFAGQAFVSLCEMGSESGHSPFGDMVAELFKQIYKLGKKHK